MEWTPAATLKQKAPFASTEVDIDRVAIDAPSVCRIILRPFNCETIETSYYGMLIAKREACMKDEKIQKRAL